MNSRYLQLFFAAFLAASSYAAPQEVQDGDKGVLGAIGGAAVGCIGGFLADGAQGCRDGATTGALAGSAVPEP